MADTEEVPREKLEALIERAAIADPDAWEALYRRLYPRLFSYARRRVPTDHAADDAVSETMTRALDKIDTFSWRGAGFDAWVFGILKNVVREHGRKTGREIPSTTSRVEPATEPCCPIEAREERAMVRAAFARLSTDEQEVLELRVVAGLQAAGAAEVLGRSSGAVRMAQSRAIQRLRTFWREVSGD